MITQEEILKHLDVDYSYRLAKRMEVYKSNPVLGYRTAGSRAEFETGEMLKQEMESIGLSDVSKDAVTVDGWEFKKAVLRFEGQDGREREVQLGAYQTTLVTDGFEECSLMYLGKGTDRDYEGKNAAGKLVLVDINQRDEWWINYPVYEAHLKGARALIAVQSGGYGEIGEEALNAQDIAGPEDAPAFSISERDARELKKLLQEKGELSVFLDADTRVRRNCTTYNITGRIPGRHPERMVLLSAHYDSYFSGFQDDNTAVAMMLGIARALVASGFQPNNTIVFCAMAAEEWGVADSNFDWSAGAYEQVFTAHPEWVGRVIADLNFELPALAHGTRARIRSCYEYVDYLNEWLEDLPNLTQAYPEETKVTAPIETWSDDFSMAIAGIPSMVNDFTGGSFMETHYHSQFDNDEFYDEQVYRLHHELFALLIEALDRTAVVPLCFERVMKRAARSLDEELGELWVSPEVAVRLEEMKQLFEQAAEFSWREYEEVREINNRYSSLLSQGREAQAEELFQRERKREAELLRRFKLEQDEFVRIDWYGNVYYLHELCMEKIRLLGGAVKNLREGKISAALRKLYQVDNNAYAFMFSEEVYRHFTEYVLDQPKDRLKWGYQRLAGHENLYPLVTGLLQRESGGERDCRKEADALDEALSKQLRALLDALDTLEKITKKDFIQR
ncbi:UNVERIFIED_ORG: peptidase [Lacrimispora saccharolytica]